MLLELTNWKPRHKVAKWFRKLSIQLFKPAMSNFKFYGYDWTKIFSSNFCSQRTSVLPDPTPWNTSSEKESAKMEESLGQVFLSVSSNLLMLRNACFKSSNLQNEVVVVILLSLSSQMSLPAILLSVARGKNTQASDFETVPSLFGSSQVYFFTATLDLDNVFK